MPQMDFAFPFSRPATAPPCAHPAGWRPVAAVRGASGNASEFDTRLVEAMALFGRGLTPPYYASLDAVWRKNPYRV